MRTFDDLETKTTTTTTEEPTELDRLLEKPRANPYEPQTHDEAWRLAQIVAASGMYGLFQMPEAAYVVLMTGRDLGLSQSQALRGIQNIKGKPAPAAATLVAVCLNHPRLCEYFEPVEITEDHATWRTKRKGRPEQTYTFSLKDAQDAGLTNAKPDAAWSKWVKRMMSARSQAFLARDIFPDLTLGLYAAEELQSEPAEIPAELESVAKWQAAKPETTESKPEEPRPDWRQAMADAPTKTDAARIGKEAIAADPSVKQEAMRILKERAE